MKVQCWDLKEKWPQLLLNPKRPQSRAEGKPGLRSRQFKGRTGSGRRSCWGQGRGYQLGLDPVKSRRPRATQVEVCSRHLETVTQREAERRVGGQGVQW